MAALWLTGCSKDPCDQWWGCEEWGACRRDGPTCAPKDDSDCARSRICTEHGYCKRAPAGYFCAGPESPDHSAFSSTTCRERHGKRLDLCKRQGLCDAVDGRCMATTDAQCQASEACRWGGTCHAFGGRCVARAQTDCEKSGGCRDEARCTLEFGYCVATDADCSKSRLCTPGSPACKAVKGQCDLKQQPFIDFQF